MRARILLRYISLGAAAVLMTFVGIVGVADGAPPAKGPVTVVTLTGGPVAVSQPLDPENPVAYPMALSPVASRTFVQRAGEVLTITMTASFSGNDEFLLCDVHAAAHVTPEPYAANSPQTVRSTMIVQRGGPWFAAFEQGRDTTRTIPAPAVDTPRTIEAVAYMDPVDTSGPDPSCFADGNPTTIMVSARISLVSLRG